MSTCRQVDTGFYLLLWTLLSQSITFAFGQGERISSSLNSTISISFTSFFWNVHVQVLICNKLTFWQFRLKVMMHLCCWLNFICNFALCILSINIFLIIKKTISDIPFKLYILVQLLDLLNDIRFGDFYLCCPTIQLHRL